MTMTNLSIETRIIDYTIHLKELHRSHNFSAYFYVNADIQCCIKYDNKETGFILQTGHSFINNNNSLPSNDLEIYDESCDDKLLLDISFLCEIDFDDNDTIESLNAIYDTNYTADYLRAIYLALQELINEAQNIIVEAENKAESELEDDNTIYVLQRFVDIDNDGNVYAESYPDLLTFTDRKDADIYLSNNKYSSIISKEEAYSEFPEQI